MIPVRCRRRLLPLLVLAGAVLAAPFRARAHDLTDREVRGISGSVELRVETDCLKADYWIAVGDVELVTLAQSLDADHDLRVSAAEKDAYLNAVAAEIREPNAGYLVQFFHEEGDRRVEIPGSEKLTFEVAEKRLYMEGETLGTAPVKLNVQLRMDTRSLPGGPRRLLAYFYNVLPRPMKMKMCFAAGPDVRLSITDKQLANATTMNRGDAFGSREAAHLGCTYEILPGTGEQPWPAGLPKWVPGAESGTFPAGPVPRGADAAEREELAGWVRRWKEGGSGLAFLWAAFAAAFLWGAGHALAPGHGKAMVAAYLVGSRGTRWHAVILGLTVTLTHVSSVIAIALALVFFASHVSETAVQFWTRLASGLGILGIGGWLLVQRLGGKHGHDHGPGGHSHGPQGHVHDPGSAGDDEDEHARAHRLGLAHDHAHSAHAAPAETGASVVEVDPVATAEQETEATTPVSVPPDPGKIGWKTLLPLGISGGIVPCPTAWVILLLSLEAKVPWFGLALVLAFSVGLAAVLVAIGLLMVTNQRLLNRWSHGEKFLRAAGIASAGIITILGAGITWATLTAYGVIPKA